MEPLELLQELLASTAGEERTQKLDALEKLVKSGEFRDAPFAEELYGELMEVLSDAMNWHGQSAKSDVMRVEGIFLAFTRAPEFDAAPAAKRVTEEFLWSLCSRTDGTAPKDEWPLLRDILLWVYQHCIPKRALLRTLICKALRSFVQAPRSAPVAQLLQVLAPVIRGFKTPLTQIHKSLLLDVLLPLHKPNEYQSWDRQSALFGLYYKELAQCIQLFLEKQPSLGPRCLEGICKYFPTAREANTPKEVLLIHAMQRVLKVLDHASLHQVCNTLLQQMARLLNSHNAQPVESVLLFWKDEHIEELFKGFGKQFIPPLMPVLLRGGETCWNPTVNRMTFLVLQKLEESDPQVFAETAEELWGPGRRVPAFEVASKADPLAVSPEGDAMMRPAQPVPKGTNIASLKFGMGAWKPPAAGNNGGTAAAAGPSAPGNVKGPGAAKPPSTVTGVAPWAFSGKKQQTPGPLSRGTLAAVQENPTPAAERKSGIDRVRQYMKLLVPENTGAASGSGEAHWEAALSAETPTWLPTLKFHDMVFGYEDLGVGAFSVVRYARVIQKDKAQGQWAEYAVKIIDTKTMQDLGYESSVNREICVLKMLSHPGIARMVSCFRWRTGAYLVLEYAAKGDLHGILVRMGKLKEDMARFFLGETVAALNAIHEVGFVYGDLKPENVVVTASGHAKLTDFGGCRPVTQAALERTKQSIIHHLRDGDWRATDGGEEQPEAPTGTPEEMAASVADDTRVEGTVLYLPPEVVRGSAPSFASDAWAFGCMTYQLLMGRPPIWAESEREEDVRSRIVSFQPDDGATSLAELSGPARGIVTAAMQPDPAQRLAIAQAGADPFFEGLDVFNLYKQPAPELPTFDKTVAPEEGGDPRWQKRQFSKMWSVMPSPQDYVLPETFGNKGSGVAEIQETDVEKDAPFCEEVSLPVMGVARVESL